jgi:hypothetical protein
LHNKLVSFRLNEAADFIAHMFGKELAILSHGKKPFVTMGARMLPFFLSLYPLVRQLVREMVVHVCGEWVVDLLFKIKYWYRNLQYVARRTHYCRNLLKYKFLVHQVGVPQ